MMTDPADCACARLDAVEDIIAHNAFEGEFTDIAKGLPDLERIVSRVHARNCKGKDFLRVLGVSFSFLLGAHSLLLFFADTNPRGKGVPQIEQWHGQARRYLQDVQVQDDIGLAEECAGSGTSRRERGGDV
jgi:hypothetical protein